MLCPQLLKAEPISHCIDDLQLQSLKLAVTQLFCSRAEMRGAWLKSEPNLLCSLSDCFCSCSRRSVSRALSLMAADMLLSAARLICTCYGRKRPQAIKLQVHLHVAQLLGEIGCCRPDASTPAEPVRLFMEIHAEQPCFGLQFADLLPQPLHLPDGVSSPCDKSERQRCPLCHRNGMQVAIKAISKVS